MNEVPDEVKQYILATDAMTRGRIAEQHPDVVRKLEQPSTRAGMLEFLANPSAFSAGALSLATGYLAYLGHAPAAAEAPIVRSHLLHPATPVRLKAYEYLLMLYFPDKNRDAMYLLLQQMLQDPQDQVRAAAARYVESTSTLDQFRPTLARWLDVAAQRGWAGGDAHEKIERMIHPK